MMSSKYNFMYTWRQWEAVAIYKLQKNAKNRLDIIILGWILTKQPAKSRAVMVYTSVFDNNRLLSYMTLFIIDTNLNVKSSREKVTCITGLSFNEPCNILRPMNTNGGRFVE